MTQTVKATCDQCGDSRTLTLEEVDYAKMKRKLHPITLGWIQQHYLCGKEPGCARIQFTTAEARR